MRDLTRWARALGLGWNVMWTTESNPRLTGCHIHAVQWGSFVAQDVLQDRWGAIVDIRAIKSDTATVANYVAKGAFAASQYLSKATGDDYPTWLALNGGRGLHWSRGYFHGLTAKEAVKAASRAAGLEGDTVWQQVTDPATVWEMYLGSLPDAISDPLALSPL
jgi:transcription elongation factor